MNLDTFFEKFELFADAPNAVAKMRELILDLAVRGKLVPQDPTDEPASAILRLIKEDVASAVKNRKLRNPKPIETYEGELPFELPDGWELSQLGCLTSAEDNAMCDGPFGSKLKTEHYIQTPGYAVIRLGNIGVGYFIWGKEGHISQEHYLSLPSNHVIAGDLIVAGLADPLVRCCEVPKRLGPAVNKADCFRVRVHPSVDRNYVRHYLNSSIAKVFAAEENHGITRERINLSNAKALPVPLPPLAEQKRIVAKVDELMALCDRLEAQQQERESRHTALAHASLSRFADAPTPANLELLFHKAYEISPNSLRNGIFSLAEQGRLVQQDANDEPAAAFVRRLGKIHGSESPEGEIDSRVDESWIPFPIPHSWCWVRLGDLVESMTNGIYKPAKFNSEKGTACIRMFNIQDGKIDRTTMKRLVLDDSEISQYRLEMGDILVNRVNSRELVGKAGIVATVEETLVFEAMNIRVRLHERQQLPDYVNLILRTERIRTHFQAMAKQAVGQASVNQSQVASLAIPLPPLPEQKRIVAKVEQLMALVDRLEAQLVESRGKAAALLEAVVAELSAAA